MLIEEVQYFTTIGHTTLFGYLPSFSMNDEIIASKLLNLESL